ncbi:hypothetical protein J6590_024484 [Homalodisca vitripennis]|nr:hypothetical protein J6590_024484 [Homalodisca vitripennis]
MFSNTPEAHAEERGCKATLLSRVTHARAAILLSISRSALLTEFSYFTPIGTNFELNDDKRATKGRGYGAGVLAPPQPTARVQPFLVRFTLREWRVRMNKQEDRQIMFFLGSRETYVLRFQSLSPNKNYGTDEQTGGRTNSVLPWIKRNLCFEIPVSKP